MVQESQKRATGEAVERSGMHPAVIASAASVLLSWYVFFVRGEKQRGIFVGLWPPTFLAFASYFEQMRTRKQLERSMGQRLVERIEDVVQTA